MRRTPTNAAIALVVSTSPACFAPTGNIGDTSPEPSTSTSDTTQSTGPGSTTGSTGPAPTSDPTTGQTTTSDVSSSGTSPTSSTTTTAPPDSCADGTLDGDETDLDCGGSCPPCDADQNCQDNDDCASKACKSGVCLGEPACTDDVPCEPSALACHASACVEFACVDQPQNGIVCDDGLVCTQDDACDAGACVASSPKPVYLADVAQDPALGLHFDGAATGQLAGSAVAVAGDINDDGELDVLIATRKTANLPARVYVLFGGPSLANATLAGVASGTGGFMIDVDTGDSAIVVASVGDINNDGPDDVLIGAPFHTTAKGAAIVVFGKQSDTDAVKVSALGSAGFTLQGPSTSSYFGTSVAGLGDLNGDGHADFAVGAPGFKSNNVLVGAVYLVFGAGFPASDTIDNYLAMNKARRIDGPGTSTDFGRVVGTVGDFNKDGKPDLAVGQPGWNDSKGRVIVLYLQKPPVSFTVPDPLPPGEGLVVTNSLINSLVGGVLGPAGDFNGDGAHDLLIGTSGTFNRAFVVLGGNIGGTLDAAQLVNQSNGFIVSGLANELLGQAAWGALDVNADGRSDVVLGAPGYNTETGRAYVVFGRAMPAAIVTSDLVAGNGGFAVEGQATLSKTGSSVALLPDRNGDGKAEVLLGASHFDPMAVDNAGRAYIVHGGDCKP